MNNTNLKRRRFIQSTLMTGLAAGSGGLLLPKTAMAQTGAVPLSNRLLLNLFLDGGPDHRHLIVPQYVAPPTNQAGQNTIADQTTLDSDPVNAFAQLYWHHRQRSHSLAAAGQTAEQRWNDDYYHFTVGGVDADSGFDWNGSGLVDVAGLNTNATGELVRFGIWKEASWLIDMFIQGNVAFVFNAVGGTNRAHDLSQLMMNQGNLLSTLNDQDRSGWGGRLARSAGGNALSVTSSPSRFCFGPVGNAPNYDPDAIDNRDLISVDDSRRIGLYDPGLDSNDHGDHDANMGRAAKNYYAALRQEVVSQAYLKFLDHEQKVRAFGEQVSGRLIGPDDDNPIVPIPTVINALRNTVPGINVDPNNPQSTGRRVLRSSSFANQIRNIYDVIAVNDLLTPTVISTNYGGWDTHGDQRRLPPELPTDPTTISSRGIESNYRDIFGGKYGNSPINGNALHGGFSALWDSLSQQDLDKIVLTVAGEFGRQIRDNGDAGTDHGKGNLFMVIGDGVNGGVYGEMFPTSEIDKYDDSGTPDITPLTELDHVFSQVCDWVSTGSGDSVFPRMASGSSSTPDIEVANMFNSLFTS